MISDRAAVRMDTDQFSDEIEGRIEKPADEDLEDFEEEEEEEEVYENTDDLGNGPPLLGEEYRHRLPVLRSDCLPGGINEMRPCPWKTCEFHTVEGHQETCVLDAVDRTGEHTLEEIGEILNLTRERIRQVEQAALRRMKRHGSRTIER